MFILYLRLMIDFKSIYPTYRPKPQHAIVNSLLAYY